MNIATRICLAFATITVLAGNSFADTEWSGSWELALQTNGGPLPIQLSLQHDGNVEQDNWSATITNGPEQIDVPVKIRGEAIVLDMPHYDSKIKLNRTGDTLAGTWTKTRGADEVATVAMKGTKRRDAGMPQLPPSSKVVDSFIGRFEVKFADSDELAIGVFSKSGPNQIEGTFLTATGDYRYLFGAVGAGDQLVLSCFDGAHAFLFHARHQDGKLEGDFWSGNWYHTRWTAHRNPDAKLADGFSQTTVNTSVNIAELQYFDLLGKPISLGSPRLRGKVTILELFGSWCPNCHDAASLLGTLHEKYHAQGLKVVGLGFELTGNQERDLRQLSRYRDRYAIDYPVLLAGLANKEKASRAFPLIDRIRSYPTTIFIDQAGKVRSAYSGFSGPATGAAHQELRESFEQIVVKLLNE
ncbi:MAG: hypothetical protein Aurels2KO_35740 [Aureliella sp.]